MQPDPRELARAVQALRAGGLVAMPTETVYGLAARALDPQALRRLFAAKGRPADHPVIVHAADATSALALARDVPDDAHTLAGALWPGPLTLVLRRAPGVPDEVTGGQDTVGLRVPAHPVALALLRALGEPVAAPSANRFGRVSPTTADHVRRDLGDRVDVVLDGGSAEVGVESTIVEPVARPAGAAAAGAVTRARLESLLGRPVRVPGAPTEGEAGAASAEEPDRVRAPGTLAQHYAPRARVLLVPAADVTAEAARLRAAGARVAELPVARDDAEAAALAHDLYARLRAADDEGADVIVAAAPAEHGLGAAVADRLRRAAATRGTS